MNTDENEIYYQQQLAQMRSELYNSIIQWDLPRARLTGYMFKTLPAYLKAADKVVKSVMEGQSVGGAINDQFEGALLSFILKKMNVEEMQSNPVSPTGIYTNFDEWRADAKKAGVVRFEGSKDNLTGLNAKGSGIADWDGVEGYIYKRIRHDEGKTNPVRPRRGESSRDFVSRCMSEEKQSFPKQKQRIAVCLSKARRNPFPDRNADE